MIPRALAAAEKTDRCAVVDCSYKGMENSYRIFLPKGADESALTDDQIAKIKRVAIRRFRRDILENPCLNYKLVTAVFRGVTPGNGRSE